jgi:hypothetical protein
VRRVTARTKIFGIEIVLQDVRPVVSRRVQVPGETTLAELHEVALFRFDPAAFDLVEVNEAMAWLAWRPLPSSTNRSTKDRLATMVEDHHRHPKGPTHHNIRNDV